MRASVILVACVLLASLGAIVYAKTYMELEDLLSEVFADTWVQERKIIGSSANGRESSIMDRENGEKQEVDVYMGRTMDDTDAYCVIVKEEGKHGSITFAVVINERRLIEKMSVLESDEVRGAKIAKRRFTKQFVGKGVKDPVSLKEDVDGITGATISSRAATKAARKALLLIEEMPSAEDLSADSPEGVKDGSDTEDPYEIPEDENADED